jgi:large subunit ribosomal protein L9
MPTQVILLEDVEKVGLRGEVVSVARGFARNYLLPRKLAETATAARVAELERREAQRARHEARSVDQAREIAAVLEKAELRFDVKAGPTGALFGSVTATDIADELWSTKKIRIDRRKIDLSDSIKRIGRYQVPIDVFQDVRVEVRTLIVPEGGELPPEEELEAAAEAEAKAAEEAAAAAEQAHVDAETHVAEVIAQEEQEAEQEADEEAELEEEAEQEAEEDAEVAEDAEPTAEADVAEPAAEEPAAEEPAA